MFDLEALIISLHATQCLQFSRRTLINLHTFGHDLPLTYLLTPTRQHERVDVKRFRKILNGTPGSSLRRTAVALNLLLYL